MSESNPADPYGHTTLEAIAKADKFNEWMFKTIQPYIKGDVLEIGSGIGNISSFILQSAGSVTLSDIDGGYCNILKNKFSGQKNLVSVLSIDLVDQKFDSKFQHLFDSFDSIIALNVVEHIENDDLAIKNCKKLLRQNGNLIILVPAFTQLYNSFDESLGHYRRYTIKQMNSLIGNHLQPVHSQYFNFAGIFGWFISGSILKKKNISSSQMMLYNKLVPVFRLTDKILFNRVGLSVIVIAQKQ